MDLIVLLSQLGLMSVITGWLILGARDNILYPQQNQRLTDLVVSMELMAAEYPQFYADLSHRKITEKTLQRRLFRAIVVAEVIICLVLIVAILSLIGALLGVVPISRAAPLALFGAFGFTMIWASFLTVGNHFAYWLCHKEQQMTHYQMTFWGLGTMVFLVASG